MLVHKATLQCCKLHLIAMLCTVWEDLNLFCFVNLI